MQKTTRRAALALLLALLLALVGCGGRKGQPEATQLPLAEVTLAPENAPAGASALPQATAQAPSDDPKGNTESLETGNAPSLDADGVYDSAEDVALYLYTYGQLPDNYMTKDEAEELGWTGGSLERYAPGMCIGGDRFGNYEGQLPKANGRTWSECDIDTLGRSNRGAKRIVYSNDGLIYYTDDHYETFERIYPED